MTKILSIGAIVIVLIIALVFTLTLLGVKVPFLAQTKILHLKGQTFTVEIANTTAEKERGLSKRKTLADDRGMLFLFTTPDYLRFWMKDMQFPIDMIFIKGNKIVTLYTNVPVPSADMQTLPVYVSKEPADKVLEVNAGIVNKYSIKEGDTITIDL